MFSNKYLVESVGDKRVQLIPTYLLTHSKQYTSPPLGPYPSSPITSSRLTRSLISIAGSCSKLSGAAAGSRLTR